MSKRTKPAARGCSIRVWRSQVAEHWVSLRLLLRLLLLLLLLLLAESTRAETLRRIDSLSNFA